MAQTRTGESWFLEGASINVIDCMTEDDLGRYLTLTQVPDHWNLETTWILPYPETGQYVGMKAEYFEGWF